MSELAAKFSSLVWGIPLMVVLVGAGLFLTIRLRFIQFRGFRHGIQVLRRQFDRPDDPGEISHFSVLATAAFDAGLPGSGWVVSAEIILFAFSTLVAWSYYGDRAVGFLFGPRAVVPYRCVYVVFVIIGAVRSLDDVINFCDALNGLMALPNLIALLALSPVVINLTKDYMDRMKKA